MILKRPVLLNKIEADENLRKRETTKIAGEQSIPTEVEDVQKKTKKTVNVIENARIRPKSALGVNNGQPWKSTLKKRPNSFCAFEKSMSQGGICAERYDRKFQDFNVQLKQREMNTVMGSSCVCGINCTSCPCTQRNHFALQRKKWLAYKNRWTAEQQRIRRCRSTPNISDCDIRVRSQVFYSGNSLSKFKRSLALLGFDPSDFGIYCKKTREVTWKKTRSLPKLSTKLTRRTVSLDSLKEAIREAWADDCLGFHQRKLLSQAAYEEWYFRKERAFQIKQEEKKMEAFRKQEKIYQDYLMKKVRAKEEFRKWVLRKKRKIKENDDNCIKTFQKSFDPSGKTKEEIESAFLRWKQGKDKELREKNKKKKREEENNRESERQKMERKVVAEKAFQQWKNKLYKWKKFEKENRQKKQELFEKRQKREKDGQISFQIWKATKDEAIRQKSNEMRHVAKLKRKERVARMEERLYEAEQAFEEWLEKKSFRKQTNTETRQKNIPWIPI